MSKNAKLGDIVTFSFSDEDLAAKNKAHDVCPAIVTDVDEDGNASLTLFLKDGSLQTKHMVGTKEGKGEYYSTGEIKVEEDEAVDGKLSKSQVEKNTNAQLNQPYKQPEYPNGSEQSLTASDSVIVGQPFVAKETDTDKVGGELVDNGKGNDANLGKQKGVSPAKK